LVFFVDFLLIAFNCELALAIAEDDMVVDESVVRRSLGKANDNIPTELRFV